RLLRARAAPARDRRPRGQRAAVPGAETDRVPRLRPRRRVLVPAAPARRAAGDQPRRHRDPDGQHTSYPARQLPAAQGLAHQGGGRTMSKRIALKDLIRVDGVDISNFCRAVTFTSTDDRIDASGFNSTGASEFLSGQRVDEVALDVMMG